MKCSFCLTIVFLSLTIITLSATVEGGQSSLMKSHRDLNWSAQRRWLHVDNVDSLKAVHFENARKEWLTALRKDNQLLGDGRPLFWSTQSGKVATYFTFFPFDAWSEMDARRDMILQTEKIIGQPAIDSYDLGDSVLIPPHYSQLWMRREKWDIPAAENDSLREVNALAGRLEIRFINYSNWDEFEKLWADLRKALINAHYPLTCRMYTNMFGRNQGECAVFWLAPTLESYRRVAPLREVLQQLRNPSADEMLSQLDDLFPLQASYDIIRRPDLSNLGK